MNKLTKVAANTHNQQSLHRRLAICAPNTGVTHHHRHSATACGSQVFHDKPLRLTCNKLSTPHL